jgi:hypothetical protein
MPDAGQEADDARRRDDHPADAARLQQSGSIASGLAQIFGSQLGLFLFVVGQDCSCDSRHQGSIGEYFVWNIGISDPVDALRKSPIRLDELEVGHGET